MPFPPIHPNFANNPATGQPFLISEMAPGQIWSAYIRYIGAGAVLAAGLITLARTIPTIVVVGTRRAEGLRRGAGGAQLRTERDMPMTVVLGGSLLLALFLAVAPGLPTQGNVLVAVLILIFGFFFATVSSRITGLIGSSSNPISGMTIATLIITCLIFVALGWTGDVYAPIALSVGAIVCIAAANAGNTSQDLKTGYIVGATPIYQQIGLAIGVITSAFVIGWTVLYLHQVFGIGSAAVAAPQATLMATLIKGLLSQNLPWGLVLVGVFIAVTLELCGIHSLSFAVGVVPADRHHGADLRRRPGAVVGGAQDRRDQRVGPQRRHALQLGPHRRRIAGRHPLRRARRHRDDRARSRRSATRCPSCTARRRSATCRRAAVPGAGRHPGALRAQEDRVGRVQRWRGSAVDDTGAATVPLVVIFFVDVHVFLQLLHVALAGAVDGMHFRHRRADARPSCHAASGSISSLRASADWRKLVEREQAAMKPASVAIALESGNTGWSIAHSAQVTAPPASRAMNHRESCRMTHASASGSE